MEPQSFLDSTATRTASATRHALLFALTVVASPACSDDPAAADTSPDTTVTDTTIPDTTVTDTTVTDTVADTTPGVTDFTNAIFLETSGDCGDYAREYAASVKDLQSNTPWASMVSITTDGATCSLTSNNIPNHDFNQTGRFATPIREVDRTYVFSRLPTLAATSTALSQRSFNAIMLNGVPLDLLSAGCYRPNSPGADANGNVAIGCTVNDPWLLDPLGANNRFGTDEHNAHTQPDGTYHYHGNPNAMFDDEAGDVRSPVIGFAADGFPIYGTWFPDPTTGVVRKAISGYTLKAGMRPSSASDPGGSYDGTYVDDWEFTAAGDLDACNGMTVDGQYGYYVTDAYPWVMGCLSGTPNASFDKGRP